MKFSSILSLPILLGGYTYQQQMKLDRAKEESAQILNFIKEKYGIPGIVLGVSINGKNEFLYSVGYSDIENLTQMKVDTTFRMASISKVFTSLCTALLYQQQKINLDAPIQEYVPTFPLKFQDGKEVQITIRKLLNHTSGIRHYFKNKSEEKQSEYENKEFHSNINYPTALDALNYFKDDELYFKQGEFGYSTHAYTLIQAAIEQAAQKPFKNQVQSLCQIIGLKNTQFDVNSSIIKNRCRAYFRKKGQLYNCPEVNLSNKWAGGGLITNTQDLLRFGNFLLYCYQQSDGPIKQEVLKYFLKDGLMTNKEDIEKKYTLGFSKREYFSREWIIPKIFSFSFGHSGGAVGCTSNLLIIPNNNSSKTDGPQGIVVIVAGNLTSAKGIARASQNISDLFWQAIN